MTLADFALILAEEAEADENTDFILALLGAARQQIAGKGTIAQLTASSVNGKSFTRFVQFTPLEVIQACRSALKIVAGVDDSVSSTRPDFRCLDR